MKTERKIILSGIALVLFAIPLIRTGRWSFDTIFFPRQVFAQVALTVLGMVFLVLFRRDDEQGNIRTPLDMPAAAFVAVCVIAALFAPVKYLALGSVLFTVAAISLFFIASRTIETVEDAFLPLAAIMISAALVSVIGLYQLVGEFSHGSEFKLVHLKSVLETTLGGTNLTAQFLVIALFVCAALAYFEYPVRGMPVSVSALIFAALLFTLSRGAYLGLATGAGAALFFSRGKVKKSAEAAPVTGLKKIVIAFGVIAVLFGAFAFVTIRKDAAAFSGLDDTQERGAPSYGMNSIFEQTSDSFSLRMHWWRDAVEMIKDHPVTGVGPGNFEALHFRYRDVTEKEMPPYTRVTSPHSDILHYWSEMGPAGGILFLAILVVVFAAAGGRGAVEGRRESVLRACCGGAMAAIAVQGIIDFNLHNPVPALCFWFLAGIMFSPALMKNARKKAGSPILFESFRYAAMVMVTVVLFVSVRQLSHEMHAGKGLRLMTRGDDHEAVAELARSISIMSGDYKPYIFLGRLYERNGDFGIAAKYMKEGISRYPYYYSFIENLGEIYYKAGDYGEAEKAYRRAIEIYPVYSQPWYDLAFLYSRQGLKEEAEETVRKAFAKSPQGGWDWNLLGALLLEIGRLEESLEAMENAVKLMGRDPYVLYNFAYAQFMNGNKTGAVSTIENAIVSFPNDPQFYSALDKFRGGHTPVLEIQADTGSHSGNDEEKR